MRKDAELIRHHGCGCAAEIMQPPFPYPIEASIKGDLASAPIGEAPNTNAEHKITPPELAFQYGPGLLGQR
jgi:hypothetical protein